ncbi:hypothetical protein F4781DRAFT_432904 [Annulohypoxylon bovei var. microspora]|nr:hypothetical protein F4781DRAFT_432904 [Annulohypoxylon bovei var. microspora]
MPPKPRLRPPSRVFPPATLQRQSPLLSLGPVTNSQARRIEPFYSSLRLSSSSHPSAPSRAPPSSANSSADETESGPQINWYLDLRVRLGKCIMFGCSREQAQQAASVLRAMTTEWRELTVGKWGFLAGGRMGLENHQVERKETDSFEHAINDDCLRYAETSRTNWVLQFASLDPKLGLQWKGLTEPKNMGFIMRSISSRYKHPMTCPDSFSTYHRLFSWPPTKKGKICITSVTLSHKYKRVAAFTNEAITLFNYSTRKMIPVTDPMVDTFQDVWRQQEEEKKRANARIWELIVEVEKIEKETWGKDGAVEDLGVAEETKSAES